MENLVAFFTPGKPLAQTGAEIGEAKVKPATAACHGVELRKHPEAGRVAQHPEAGLTDELLYWEYTPGQAIGADRSGNWRSQSEVHVSAFCQKIAIQQLQAPTE